MISRRRRWPALLLGFTGAALLMTQASDSSAPIAVELGHIENAFQLSAQLYSGGEPRTGADFAALQRRGIRTILSVDGARPDVELARAHGLRYLHLPIGYGTLARSNTLRLLAASAASEGPLFVHCHHGKHRGPAAAALAAMQLGGWTTNRALSWLHLAGTDTNYAGLYQSVGSFRPVSTNALASVDRHFPEAQAPAGLIEAMVAIDRTWENLQSLTSVPGRSEEPLQAEIVLLAEQLREAARLPEAADLGGEFVALMNRSGETVIRAGVELKQRKLAEGRSAIRESCRQCHRQYRD
ncbi:MAG TPA: hypothetical protein DCY13_15215 [Verrucomicrobiales bacterium]|nr:hypothetical protein [Verrucomicrobiales bacterium]